MTKTNISINVTPKAIEVKNGKAVVNVPYVSTAKGVKWYVSKACNRDYIAIGFKAYANGETRANIYLHDYNNKFASLKTSDGKALDTIAKATPMSNGKKYTVTNLSPEGLKNFAVMFADFEKARQTDSKTASLKPKATASKPTADSKPTASPKASKTASPKASKTADKPTASKTADKPTASKTADKPKTAPKASPKASKPTADKTADSKPDSKPTADSKTA